MHRAALLLVVASACHASAPTQDPNVGAPTLVSQPADKAVSPGQAATFLVRASGTGTLWYQWERNGVPIEAATAQVYATAPTALADDGATYDVVVKNLYGEVKSRAAKLSVHAGGPKTLTLHTGDAPFVAFQDGDGPWQGVAPDPNGDHAFTVTDERFGVAVGDPGAALGYVVQGTVAEVEDLFLPLQLPPATTHPVVASLSSIDADRAYLSGCQGSAAAPVGLVRCGFPAGTNDLVAVEDRNLEATAILLHRGAWVFDTGVSDLGVFDFGSPRAFAPEAHILTVHHVPVASTVGAEAGLRLRAGAGAGEYAFPGFGQFPDVDANGDVFAPIRLVPSGHLAAGDIQFATLRANGNRTTMAYSEWFHDTGDKTLEFPDELVGRPSLAASTPYLRAQMEWDASPALLLYTMEARWAALTWQCAVSRGWLAGVSAYAFPDFSGVPAWSEALAFGGRFVHVALRGDSYVDVKRSLTFALYARQLAPPPGDTTLSVTSILGDGVTLSIP